MDDSLFVQDEYHELHAFAEARLMHVCFCRLQKWNFSNLSAHFWRWYWNQNPGAVVILDGNRLELSPDRVILIPPNTAFASGSARPVNQLYMHFGIELDSINPQGAVFTHSINSCERRFIDRLVRALPHQETNRMFEISFLSQALVHSALTSIPAHCWEGRLSNPRVAKAINSIKAASPKAISNASLARNAGVNVNAFTKLFLKATGQTPRQYLIHLRLEEACRLLQHGTEGIAEIAERTGFCDRYYFSRSFKQCFGIGPAAFRHRSHKVTGKSWRQDGINRAIEAADGPIES